MSSPNLSGRFKGENDEKANLYNNRRVVVSHASHDFDGEGTIGKLTKNDELYNELRETNSRVASLVTAIANGDGAAGRFIKDPALYNSLNQTSSEVQKLLYDIRQNPKKFLTITFRLF